MLAGWRLLRCNPFSHGGYDPVSRAAPVPRRSPRPLIRHVHLLANIFQPLIDIFDSVIQFFHDTVGLSWGMSIIALTVVVRACCCR